MKYFYLSKVTGWGLFVFIITWFFYSAYAQHLKDPTVCLKSGELKGDIRETASGKKYASFQGIPYAEPPVGNLRFRSPVPVKSWKGVLDATKPHSMCSQRNSLISLSTGVEGIEDCLYLNVFTSSLGKISKDSQVLPVMVFIHGGGYFSGAANTNWYEAEPLIEYDIVVVTLNYRLSILGFLSTGDEAAPGNYGLKDQSLALKWVKENIDAFGGDPDKVTIFGESAGGSSVHLHMLSPLSKGLFHRAISESGSALCSWTLAPCGESLRQAQKLGRNVGCPTSSTKKLVECLREMDAKNLTAQDLIYFEWDMDPAVPFKPVVEFPSPDAFLSDSPENLIKSGQFWDVPLIIGMNKDEGLLRAAPFTSRPIMFDQLDEDFNNKVAVGLLYKPIVQDIEELGSRIRNFYFRHQQKLNSKDSLFPLIEMYGDGHFASCIDNAVLLHRNVSKEPIYYYLFAHKGNFSFSHPLRGSKENFGVSHCDELQYIFSRAFTIKFDKLPAEDLEMRRILSSMWTNFAKTGNPTPESRKWKPVMAENSNYFYMNATVQEMKTKLFERRFKFWKEITRHFKKCVIR